MRDLDWRKQLDRTCKQRGYEQENQQPGVGVEPSEFLLQGVQYFLELSPVNKQKCRHCVSEYPVSGFKYVARLENYSVTFKMQYNADDQCDSKGNDQCDADVCFCFYCFLNFSLDTSAQRHLDGY